MNLNHHMDRMDRAFVRAFRTDDWAKRGGKCAYCRERLQRADVTGDHVVPRSKGGATHRGNIKAACEDCNKLKSSQSEKLFKRQIRTLPEKPSLPLMLAHIRLRLNKRIERAERRILASVGLA